MLIWIQSPELCTSAVVQTTLVKTKSCPSQDRVKIQTEQKLLRQSPRLRLEKVKSFPRIEQCASLLKMINHVLHTHTFIFMIYILCTQGSIMFGLLI